MDGTWIFPENRGSQKRSHPPGEVMRQKQKKQSSVRSRRQATGQPQARKPVPARLPSSRWAEPPPEPVPLGFRRPARPADQTRRGACQLTVALLAVVVIIAGTATILILELWLANHILPGVYVWDVDLGGLTYNEATTQLAAEFRYPADRHPVLYYGDQTWLVDPQDLGTKLDLAATASAALAIGHQGSMLTRLGEQLDALLSGKLVRPVFTFDAGSGTMFLSRIAGQINRPLRNASLSLGDNLTVQIVPGQDGVQVDESATLDALIRRIADMGGGNVELVVRQSQPLLTDLSEVQARVQSILNGPIVLMAAGFESWTIEPATLANWLILRPTTASDGSTTLTVSLDLGQTTRLAEEIAAQVDRAPVNAQFRFDDTAGALVPVVDSVPGQTLDVTTTVTLIEHAASSNDRTVALPLSEIRPAVATEDGPELGIVELLAEGQTNFAGSSSSRIQNIVVGTSQFDGLLIAPGETFSFDHYLGEVTAEKGYEEGIIIWGNTTRADVGGGLCQVSSTAFRAAFWAGLPIVERWPHAFRVGYYEPPVGLDATIYSPSVDLKWVNDTGNYILIQTYVDKANQTVTFRLYGTNPGRTVEMDGPYESNPVPHGPPVYRDDPTLPKGQTQQIEWPKDGLDVTIYRIIKENGVEVQRDTFFSRYRPWQAVYLVGTKEQ
jgi:vancomycin resistance protein YoaR